MDTRPEAVIKALDHLIRVTPDRFREDAGIFQREIGRRLEEMGFTLQREYRVPSRGSGGRAGRIDLVILDDDRRPVAAIELDEATPRRKSITKLRAFDGQRYILLRPTHAHTPRPVEDVDVVFSRSANSYSSIREVA